MHHINGRGVVSTTTRSTYVCVRDLREGERVGKGPASQVPLIAIHEVEGSLRARPLAPQLRTMDLRGDFGWETTMRRLLLRSGA